MKPIVAFSLCALLAATAPAFAQTHGDSSTGASVRNGVILNGEPSSSDVKEGRSSASDASEKKGGAMQPGSTASGGGEGK